MAWFWLCMARYFRTGNEQRWKASHIQQKDKAEVLNEQYQSVFTQENTGTFPDLRESSILSISDITFKIAGIEKLLTGLDTNKSNRPDEIPLRISKEYASEIAHMLTFIMQQSYDTGTLPDDWKNANVVALF